MFFFKKNESWQISENEVTSEEKFLNRRAILKPLLSFTISPFLISFPSYKSHSGVGYSFTSKINKKYIIDRKITEERFATTYTNFYEFGSSKNIWRRAGKLVTNPWLIEIDGLVKKPKKYDIREFIRVLGGEEERVYRFRCVEAWSMTVPWMGISFQKLLSLVEPNKDAKFVRFETFFNPDVAPGQKQKWYPWPYTEGISIEEAKNDLTFLATGIYGKNLPNQNGSPIRLVLPWKYGFKSIKSIVKISFVKDRPIGLWEKLAPQEYGFWANVNPNIPHPRWSQEYEKILGSSKVRKTLIFNGYEREVSYLYKSLFLKNKSILFR